MLEKRQSREQANERLTERRRRGRRLLGILGLILLLILVGFFIWLTWQPSLRIQNVTMSDTRLLEVVQHELTGSYAGIVPRNSLFFIPDHAIRAALVEADPGLEAVSISRKGLTGLSVSLHQRVAVAKWCGLKKTEGVPEYCYLFDTIGYLYAAADVASSSPLNSFVLYDPLKGNTQEPLRATLLDAAHMPDLFDFARKINSLGSPVLTITIQGDQADLVLRSVTHITYVLGSEEQAYVDITSAKENINLTNGSLEYVDVRFPGKVYLKKKGDTVTQ
jgi:hypothetical protein